MTAQALGSECREQGMAVIIGNPGYGALKGAALRIGAALVFGAALGALVVLGGAWILGQSPWIFGLFFIPLIGTELWVLRSDLADIPSMLHEGLQWLKGGRGELIVDRELANLSDEFVVFNDFHLVMKGERARWNMDHIVVGPTGLFVIDAKLYRTRRVESAKSDAFTRKNVEQVQRNAMDLKKDMLKWSGGQLAGLFVVPVVVYAQERAYVESLREGSVRVLPLRLLRHEIVGHRETAIDMDRAYRISRVLWEQLPVNDRVPFDEDFRRYGAIARASGQVKGARGGAEPDSVGSATAPQDLAQTCPNCGSILVIRTAKRGPSAGNTFLACPGFPKCRHTEPLRA